MRQPRAVLAGEGKVIVGLFFRTLKQWEKIVSGRFGREIFATETFRCIPEFPVQLIESNSKCCFLRIFLENQWNNVIFTRIKSEIQPHYLRLYFSNCEFFPSSVLGRFERTIERSRQKVRGRWLVKSAARTVVDIQRIYENYYILIRLSIEPRLTGAKEEGENEIVLERSVLGGAFFWEQQILSGGPSW